VAEFQISVAKLLALEGGWVDDPADPGQETLCGISRKNFPDWSGWQTVDRAKSQPNFPNNLLSDSWTSQMVKEFYSSQFWDPLLNELNSQTIADKILDLRVNLGTETAIRLVQRALGYLQVGPIIEDGKLGPRTIDFINGADEAKLIIELRARNAMAHHEAVLRNPVLEKFMLGWLRRAAL
jgi:lysozyme family protein